MGVMYKAQHIFRGAGGTSEDDYVNSFYLWTDDETSASDLGDPANFGLATLVADGVCDLYIHADGTGVTPGEYMSHRLYGTDETVNIYYMPTPLGTAPSGPPIFVHHKTATAGMPDVQGMPEEVAVCLSYSAINSGSNKARRRGRIYIGPLSIAAADDVAPNDQPVHVCEPLINSLNAAAENFQALLGTVDFKWRVYSKTDGFAFDIVESSVDNAFDTVRGRGTVATTRTYNTFS